MKVVQVNTVFNQGSTGKIAYQIQERSLKSDIVNIVAYRYDDGNGNGNDKHRSYCISTWLDCHIHNRLAKYTHRIGNYSSRRTKKFINYLKAEQPDIIHIHNLHGNYINIPMLFSFIKKQKIRTIWTFHDCWPFTGYCPYFEINKCDEWMNGCKECCCENSMINYHSSERNLNQKKDFVRYIDLTIVTPSHWLANVVKQTFYSFYPIKVIPNGIDLEIFHPRESSFRDKYHIPKEKYVLLGVAAVWEERKGLDVFINLSKALDSNTFQIVLVGTNSQIDEILPKNIISIHRTSNQIELAEIYSASDLFVNPTREEVLGMVNIEANACGTPVVTYDTGGSPECIRDTSGIVVPYNDYEAMLNAIIDISSRKPFSTLDCVINAKRFDCREKYNEYIKLYLEKP